MRLTYNAGSTGPRVAGKTPTMALGGAVILTFSGGGSTGSCVAAPADTAETLKIAISAMTTVRNMVPPYYELPPVITNCPWSVQGGPISSVTTLRSATIPNGF